MSAASDANEIISAIFTAIVMLGVLIYLGFIFYGKDRESESNFSNETISILEQSRRRVERAKADLERAQLELERAQLALSEAEESDRVRIAALFEEEKKKAAAGPTIVPATI